MTSDRHKVFVFDLDGTLIDSSPSILKCFEMILAASGIRPAQPLDSSIIGPPLRQTLMNITGLPSGEQIDMLVRDFKQIYDTEGYKRTQIYPGVEKMLGSLHASGIRMAIATNKRRSPTLKIVGHFGWDRYFPVVGTIDSAEPPYAGKAELIRAVLAQLKADAVSALYIGDKQEDAEAADTVGMLFCAAGWGYGRWHRTQRTVAMSPDDLKRSACVYLRF